MNVKLMMDTETQKAPCTKKLSIIHRNFCAMMMCVTALLSSHVYYTVKKKLYFSFQQHRPDCERHHNNSLMFLRRPMQNLLRLPNEYPLLFLHTSRTPMQCH